ncbi:hypothetical protein [uncultured Algimonas sp.]|uniref:hypothetical protein n=1 Tax=uncultured Algimonas sp. TaxID=1547920 RepID=UPI00261ECD6D|nr:hypothetical protein [uncultured Algimonas sp.]
MDVRHCRSLRHAQDRHRHLFGLNGPGLSTNFRALNFAEELLTAGDDVRLIFDASGAKSLSKILAPAHRLHRAWMESKTAMHGTCRECTKAYGVMDALEEADVPLLAGFKGHLAFRLLLDEGHRIATFQARHPQVVRNMFLICSRASASIHACSSHSTWMIARACFAGSMRG